MNSSKTPVLWLLIIVILVAGASDVQSDDHRLLQTSNATTTNTTTATVAPASLRYWFYIRPWWPLVKCTPGLNINESTYSGYTVSLMRYCFPTCFQS
jgi:hypothetical protein